MIQLNAILRLFLFVIPKCHEMCEWKNQREKNSAGIDLEIVTVDHSIVRCAIKSVELLL